MSETLCANVWGRSGRHHSCQRVNNLLPETLVARQALAYFILRQLEHLCNVRTSCLRCVAYVKELSLAGFRLVICQDRVEFKVVNQDPRCLLSTGTTRGDGPAFHAQWNLQQHHISLLVLFTPFNHSLKQSTGQIYIWYSVLTFCRWFDLHTNCQASVLAPAARGVDTPFKPVRQCNSM